MNKYFEQFNSLRSSKDIVDAVGSISGFKKEVTESMAIITQLKRIVLKYPNEYNVLDLCAGHSLTSLISSFLLPIKYNLAIDVRSNEKLNYKGVNRFHYLSMSIFDPYIFELIDSKTIIISVHPCGKLAKRVIEIYNDSQASNLIIMPCCSGEFHMDEFIVKKLGNYASWCLSLMNTIKSEKTKIIQDVNCLSPKNIIIMGKKY